MKRLYCILFFVAFLCISVGAQTIMRYNVNAYNGLPSNRTYYAIKDRLGYLWIATEKGVAKYNGYQFKVFSSKNGIPVDDIWSLLEDRKGRIWLYCISDEIGYIYNDRYKQVNSSGRFLFYPFYMQSSGDGLIFYNCVYSRNKQKRSIGLIKNDTLKLQNLPREGVYFITSGKVFFLDNNEIYRVYMTDSIVSMEKVCTNLEHYNIMTFSSYMSINNYLATYNNYSDTIFLLNVKSCQRKKLILENEQVLTSYQRGTFSHLVTRKNIYKLDSSMNIIAKYAARDLIGTDFTHKNYVSSLLEDSFWRTVVTTDINGIYIEYKKSHFKDVKKKLLDSKFLGTIDNSTSYFWNMPENQIQNNQNGTAYFFNGKNGVEPKKIVPYGTNGLLLLTNREFYTLEPRTGKMKLVFGSRKLKSAITRYELSESEEKTDVITFWKNLSEITDGIGMPDNSIYYLEKYSGFSHLSTMNDTIVREVLDDAQHLAMAYDKKRRQFWVYNERIVFLFSDSLKRKQDISKEIFGKLGIKKIEKIVLDACYRYAFIKADNKMFAWDLSRSTTKALFEDRELGDAQPYINKNRLIIPGTFGILFSNVSDTGITTPIVYTNTKCVYYNYINDFRCYENTINFTTDKAIYSAEIPSDSILAKAKAVPQDNTYKFIVTNNDSAVILSGNDTIAVNQYNNRLLLDVINPAGVGRLRFKYFLHGVTTGWNDLTTNELYFTSLHHDQYYTLEVLALDDVWHSRRFSIILFIVPYWWQTLQMRVVFWITGILLVLLIIYLIVYITRLIVMRKTTKQRLLLELKAIHSQINPHFIFNTLNSAQSLIEKNRTSEAYSHINKFSKLLRSYLQSSGEKYVTIEEEIGNLKNYIELQQVRFKGKIEYQFITNNIDTERIKIPALLLQPIVENAINHGLFHKRGTGHLNIEFRYDEKMRTLLCRIEDDGIGRKQSTAINAMNAIKRKSYGSQLITQLVDIFNKYEKTSIEVKYIDKRFPETGTMVEIIIKNPPDAK